MPSMKDAARMMAAGGGGMSMDTGPDESQGSVEAMQPNDTADPIADLTGILDGLEAAANELPQQYQEKLRQHIEGIRQITEEASSDVASEQPVREPAQEPMPPSSGGPGMGGEQV